MLAFAQGLEEKSPGIAAARPTALLYAHSHTLREKKRH
jgi:hypothetical protein